MTQLPAAVRESIEEVARSEKLGTHIERIDPVAGGYISQAAALTLDSGTRLFLKWREKPPSGMFEAEAEGLRALHAAAADAPAEVLIPLPIAHDDDAAMGWLLMQCVSPGQRTAATDEALGRALAAIHGADTASLWGWATDNWIGSLPQSNRSHSRWSHFWREERIAPQLGRARVSQRCREGVFDQLIEVIPDALGGEGPEEPPIALLHGDLWAGNAYTSTEGAPVLIDPAVFRGDPEVDIAMTELFGGFGERFYAAYSDVRPISAEYRSHRRDLYQLYYLLVHVNLFGASYEAGAVMSAERVVRALR